MTTNFTPADDFSIITDGLEPVTLFRRETPGGPGEAILHALRRAIETAEVVDGNRRTVESDGRYTAADVSWNFPTSEVAGEPRLGDVLVDAADRRWTILEVRRVALGARWRCFTRELAIAYGLEDLVDVLVAESGVVVQENIRSRIQHVETRITEEESTLQSVRRYRIILEESFDLDHTHRLRGPGGALYEIVSVAGFPRLGQLQTIEVERL